MVRDIGLAEELAHDALVTALEQWPRSGIPDAPGAWLMATAKNRALDVLRRGQRLEGKHEQLRHQMEARQMSPKDLDAAIDENVGDDLLRLMLIACHPILSREGRVALTLRLLGGLTGEEIARAFLVPEPTIAQRIIRAKRTLAEERVPFEVPRRAALAERLSSVLEVIYLVFNEGYSATAGEDWIRRTERSRGARPGCADGDSGISLTGANRAVRRADSAVGPEPGALGSAPDSSRVGRARTGRGDRR